MSCCPFVSLCQVRHQAKKDLWIFCFIYKYVTAFSGSLTSCITTYYRPACLYVSPPWLEIAIDR